MKILAPPTPQRHYTPAVAERPRAVTPARLGGRPGVATEVMRDLHAFADREQQRPQPAVRPFPGLMAANGAAHAACLMADTILDDLSDLAEAIVDLLPHLTQAWGDHHDRMLLTPVVARAMELLTLGKQVAQ